MAASRAAHPLAEAIVELAVPPVKEAYITLRAASSGGITRALLLHVRPGPGPGLQVALHSGVRTRDQEGSNTFGFRVAGGAFDVPTSAAGIGGFVADLLAGSDFIVNL